MQTGNSPVPRLLWMSLAWFVFAAIGFWTYKLSLTAVSRNHFPLGALLVITFVLCGTAVRFRKSPLNVWLWTLLPFLGCFALFWRSDALLRAITAGTSPESLVNYGLSSAAFLILAFCWIVFHPDSSPASVNSSSSARPALWKSIFLVLGCALATIGTRSAIRDISASDVYSFQLWLVRAGLALYGILVLRVLLPATVRQGARAE